nr:sigma-70 family RNA polymerase sigma factor [Mucilaginibacter sp. L294]
MTDEALMLCIKNDDLDKAAIIYDRYKQKLFNFFLFKNHLNRELSNDSVQQVFYRMIKYRKSYNEVYDFSKWIYGIAKNIHNQDINARKKAESLQSNYRVEEVYEIHNDDHAALRQAIEKLPEPYRETLLMSKFLQMKYEEIAELNNCSVGVIKTRVFRAVKMLREVYLKII